MTTTLLLSPINMRVLSHLLLVPKMATPPILVLCAIILTHGNINVGQGDRIFIKLGDVDILIDAGKSGQGAVVASYLQSMGVDDIELMINTHPDEDH